VDDTDEKGGHPEDGKSFRPEQGALRNRIAVRANHRRYRFFLQNYLFGWRSS
jgi:hypothetical protein